MDLDRLINYIEFLPFIFRLYLREFTNSLVEIYPRFIRRRKEKNNDRVPRTIHEVVNLTATLTKFRSKKKEKDVRDTSKTKSLIQTPHVISYGVIHIV